MNAGTDLNLRNYSKTGTLRRARLVFLLALDSHCRDKIFGTKSVQFFGSVECEGFGGSQCGFESLVFRFDWVMDEGSSHGRSVGREDFGAEAEMIVRDGSLGGDGCEATGLEDSQEFTFCVDTDVRIGVIEGLQCQLSISIIGTGFESEGSLSNGG
jgi:hypothetical protein